MIETPEGRNLWWGHCTPKTMHERSKILSAVADYLGYTSVLNAHFLAHNI